jgi:glutamate-1-semialdehyde 2,1-aminomutase
MGLRAVTLGHGFAPVVDAVAKAAAGGVNFSRPSIWELQAGRAVPQRAGSRREMVKFAKNGST